MILSKVYDRTDDFDVSILGLIEAVGLQGQHWSRRWEYGMALMALRIWKATHPQFNVGYDVGGGGSPFVQMIHDSKQLTVYKDFGVIDPEPPSGFTLAQYVRTNPRLADAVFCISVIEHVDDLDQFLYHLSCLVAPGGLLFLTTDFCDGSYDLKAGGVPDVYHWHWMRKRIFNVFSMNQTAGAFYRRDFEMLGGLEADWKWHGPIENWGYAPASLALVKRL